MKKEEKLKLITMQLIKEKLTTNDEVLRFKITENHYENHIVHNMNVLNKFAYLGIYNYTKYLFLDFYEGYAKVYFQYFFEDKPKEIKFDCFSYNEEITNTDEIIYKIFELTILSDKQSKIKEDDDFPF